eukprot:773024-Rhodomonas_salina.1
MVATANSSFISFLSSSNDAHERSIFCSDHEIAHRPMWILVEEDEEDYEEGGEEEGEENDIAEIKKTKTWKMLGQRFAERIRKSKAADYGVDEKYVEDIEKMNRLITIDCIAEGAKEAEA